MPGYTYDNLGRLVASSQTSNGASAQRRFNYDRWGNRKEEYDSTSGGNQLQSMSLAQSSGAPTNRIQTVYPARTNVALATNGATASASSTYPESNGYGSYPASGVIDGDRKGTNWGSGGGWNDGTANSYPDWVQVNFNGSKTINEIDVFTLQDNFTNPVEPTEDMTFNTWGIVGFQVQYWNGSSWQTAPGGSVTGNNKVWNKFTFSDITTDKIRMNVTNAWWSYSCVTEIEAYQSSGATNYSYDAAGNVTNDGLHSYTYDAENRLVSVDGGTTAQYRYDHQNRRVSKIIGAMRTDYIWEGSHVIAEHDGNTPSGAYGSTPYGARSSQVDYVYAGSKLVESQSYTHTCHTDGAGTITCTTTISAQSYYLSHRLSTRLVLDGVGNVTGRMAHLPFGEDFAESGSQEKHHFTSYERDGEAGSDYAVNRQYSPSVGRFTQPDPASASLRMSAPQSWNRYSYTRNEPVDQTDPVGLLDAPTNPDDCPAWDEFCNGDELGFVIRVGNSKEKNNRAPRITCSNWVYGFNFASFDTKLAEAVFIEFSGDIQEGTAIAYAILNRVWFLNQPQITSTLGFGPKRATIEQVLGAQEDSFQSTIVMASLKVDIKNC